MKDWEYQGKKILSLEDIPEGSIGFIYKLTDKDGKFYIGKKSLYSITNPEVSFTRWQKAKKEGLEITKTKNKAESKKAGKVVWRYKIKNQKTETDWKSYHGSGDIKKIATEQEFSREILRFCYTPGEMTLREVEEQFKKEVLFRCDCYNGNILGKFFKQIKC